MIERVYNRGDILFTKVTIWPTDAEIVNMSLVDRREEFILPERMSAIFPMRNLSFSLAHDGSLTENWSESKSNRVPVLIWGLLSPEMLCDGREIIILFGQR